jgi:predicted NUDIX family phosphoesterase
MEFVFVVPRSRIFRGFYPQGLVPFGAEFSLEEFLVEVRKHGFFVERDVAERTPEWKQVIPYSVVTCDTRVLLTRRLGTGGEARLHDKLSIGIGGHINPEDALPEAETAAVEVPGDGDGRAAWTGEANSSKDPREDPVAAGTRREVEEELSIHGEVSVRPVGILNDDSNAVGAVHVGLVQVLQVRGDVKIREREILEGELVPPADLHARLRQGANYETWSRILVERLDEILPEFVPGGTGPTPTELETALT